jgi:tRNA-uridine 2-sulfurtransferase
MAQKSQESKTVVVGMSGRMDSAVTAYLLKKQGHRCIGVGISFIDPLAENFKNFGPCQTTDFKKVQAICENLGIPFYAVNAQDQYKELVLDAKIASRLAGGYFDICSACNALKIQILCEKAKVLRADTVATGHFAKISYTRRTREYYLYSSIDPQDDQSFELSRIDQQYLPMLIFPMGDMRREEVDKIARGLGFHSEHLNAGPGETCLPQELDFIRLINSAVAPSLFREGSIVNLEDKSVFCEHPGIHYFYIGKSNVQFYAEIPIDPAYRVVHIDYNSGGVYISRLNRVYEYNYLQLSDVNLSPLYDIAKPVKMAAVQLGPRQPRIECEVYYKTNKTVVINFPVARHEILKRGQLVSIYRGMTNNSPLLGSGYLRYFCKATELDRLKDVRDKDKVKETLKEVKDDVGMPDGF